MPGKFTFKKQTGGEITFAPPTVTHRYVSTGALSPLPAGDYFSWLASFAMANVPASITHPGGATLYRQDIQVHESYYANAYELTVPYAEQQKESGAYQISVNGTGGTTHVTAGTRVTGYGPDGSETDAPDQPNKVDNGGLIGVDGDEIHGIDVPVPQTKITVNFRHPAGKLDAEYVKAITELAGRPNKDTFLTYEPGEVRFLAPTFTETMAEATAQYDFAISRNRKDFKVGGITVTEKPGWDILSPYYGHDVDNEHGVRKLLYLEQITAPGGLEWIDYVPVFGWGG